MERYAIRMASGPFICEFGLAGGVYHMYIWEMEFDHLPCDHLLNAPKYSDENYFLLHMESHDGYSQKDMVRKAGQYGFTEKDFVQNFNKWKTRQITMTSMP